MQPQLDRRRGWTSVRQIGSPFRLARVVWTLSRDESAIPAGSRPDLADVAARNRHAIAVKKTLLRYLGFLSMKRSADHYARHMGIDPATYGVAATLDQAIAGVTKDGALDRAAAEAASLAPTDFDFSALGARKIEFETGVFRADMLEPADFNIGINTYDVYRHGTVLEEQGRTDDAVKMYRRALEADPAFSLALRRLGSIERARDPLAAARHYSDAMEFVPKEFYGAIGILHPLAVHKNFVIAKWDGEFIAVPVAVGIIDFTSTWLKSPLRRFIGLYLMRLRLRRSAAPGGAAEIAAGPPPRGTGHVVNVVSSGIAAAPSIGLKARVRQSLGAPVRWLLKNYYLFHFVIADTSIEALKSRIDKIDRDWLSRTAAVS